MAHSPGPWLYRPNEYDDWGWVRLPSEDGIGPLVACARSGKYEDEAGLDEHRRNGTDPYGDNARLISAAPDMLAAILTTLCPAGGWTGRKEETPATVADCLADGSCGCDLGAAVRKASPTHVERE